MPAAFATCNGDIGSHVSENSSPDKKGQNSVVKEDGKQNKDGTTEGKNRIRKKKTFGQSKSVSWSDVYARSSSGCRDKSSVESDESDEARKSVRTLINGPLKLDGVVKRPKKQDQGRGKLNHFRGSGSFESDIVSEEEEVFRKESDENNDVSSNKLGIKECSVENNPNLEILSMELKNFRENSSMDSGNFHLPESEREISNTESEKLAAKENMAISIDPTHDKGGIPSDLTVNGYYEDHISTDSTSNTSSLDLEKVSDNIDLSSSGAFSQTANDSDRACPKIDKTKDVCTKKKESETDTDRDESDHDVKTFQGLRRRKPCLDDSSESGASYNIRSRRNMSNLLRKEKDRSSSEIEMNDKIQGINAEEDNKV